jgi:hypothetical protein
VSEPGDSAQVDDGAAIHYLAVAPGTAVYSADGVEIGTVREILDNAREHIFDGVVFKATDGSLRFADAPEVARTAERGVTLTLSAERAAELGPPQGGTAFPKPSLGSAGGGSIFGRLFGRGRD